MTHTLKFFIFIFIISDFNIAKIKAEIWKLRVGNLKKYLSLTLWISSLNIKFAAEPMLTQIYVIIWFHSHNELLI